MPNEGLIKNILVEQLKYSYERTFIFPIDEKIICESFEDLINESDDPDYFVKFPKELETLTLKKLNELISKDELLLIFPELKKFKFPKIYIACFEFSNHEKCREFLTSICNLKNDEAISTLRMSLSMKPAGAFVDLSKFGLDIAFILLNDKKFNSRTIYHEWTHFFQRYVPKDELFKIVKDDKIYLKEIDEKLKKFQLNFDGVMNFFLSDKEYITRCDNLLYAIHQVQKLDKYKEMSDNELVSYFIKTFETDDNSCLNSELFNDFVSINQSFKIDILFFVSCFICFKDSNEFEKLCFEIENRV